MKKTVKKLIAVASALTLLGGMACTMVACGGNQNGPGGSNEIIPDPGYEVPKPPEESPFDENDDPSHFTGGGSSGAKTSGDPVTDYFDNVADAGNKTGTFRTYTASVPSLWNELDSMDENNQQIMSYLGSAFYEYDYLFDEDKGGKFKADGSINAEAIVDGQFDVKFSAATKLDDVTEEYAETWGYDENQVAVGGYAWKITLRNDLKWNDGTAIDATDFVYSMQQQLDPKFGFRRASSYYSAISVKGAKNYVYQGQVGWYGGDVAYEEYTEDLDSKLIFSLASATENKEKYGGATASVRSLLGAPASFTVAQMGAYVASSAGVSADAVAALEGKTFAQIKADESLKATWDAVIGWWQTEPNEELHFFVTQYTWPEFDFENVGVFSPSKYEIVVCFTTSESFLKSDGSLSYLAAYEMASLPLVKKDLFESSLVAPSEGSTLWTSKYNTTLETTASWGPYMLTSYQSGKGYTLSKNPHWYGYNLNDNKNQYNIDKITCEAIPETNTQWMKMFSGEIDSIGIDVTHADDFRNSKYTYYTPGSYTFSWHLFSDLNVLKDSGRNNGILAIDDFRKALSLSIDRDAYAAANTTAYRGAYGYLNSTYYYDVENGGVYRNSDVAKAGLLRAYGYTEDENGKWSLSTNSLISDLSLDEAYETLNGFNLDLAKEYIEKAYTRLTKYSAYYGYDPSKKIQIKFGTSTDTDSTRREFNYINETVLPNLLKGTSLEGKVELVFDASFGDDWDSAFAAGQYELCTSAWGSATFNPHYFIGAYIDPDNAYTASYWDTESVEMTMTVPGNVGDFPGAGKVRTMTLMNWYRCLNGYEIEDTDKYSYDWSAGKIPAECRNEILAALEEFVLEQYYSIPTITQNSATLVGAKFSYISHTHNTFLDYGGVRYRIVNYTDSEWTTFVSSQGGNLETYYKSTN